MFSSGTTRDQMTTGRTELNYLFDYIGLTIETSQPCITRTVAPLPNIGTDIEGIDKRYALGLERTDPYRSRHGADGGGDTPKR